MTQRSWPQKASSSGRSAAEAIPLAPAATPVAKAPILLRAVRRPISSAATRVAAAKVKGSKLPDDCRVTCALRLNPGSDAGRSDAAPNWHDARDTQPSVLV